ncbi:MAG: carboxypeptidase regulatory-like domain-containing protein, partial [Candidatus Thermoplasmatota archaeon]|nr:carboxypeptidase regulatory-like domain-containing protein [Candidatus Thermoplasmatota archaeon]
MRKRAEFKNKSMTYEPKHISESKPKTFDKKIINISKNWWVALALISIFLLVLFFNTYFNFTSEIAIYSDGEGYSKYLLSGPDPYYNLRLVEETSKTGIYPYYSDSDPLLNYPLGVSGNRAPLLNMMALGFSNFLAPFIGEIDAIGYSMQFVPALFGALLVFPIFFIGKVIFNKKVGLIAAFFIAIIPIFISSGHGSSYSLFDHDSLNLLLFFLTFLFLILSLKEKNHMKSIFYAILAGVPLAGLSMVWVEAQYLYVIIAIYTIVQMIIDIFLSKIEINVFRATSITILTGYIISLPVTVSDKVGFTFDTSLFMVLVVVGFGFLYYLFGVKRIPWTLSLPFIFISGVVGVVFLYFVRYFKISVGFLSGFNRIADILFGSGIYGNKVSMTIAEANTYEISQTVMNFGPALYWVGWAGFIFILWYYYREKLRRDYLFFIVLFIINVWFTTTAGRFLNDMVPCIAIFAGFITWFVVDKIDYKQMVKNIRSAGWGLHGLRRGIKLMHIFGILLIAFIIILPNVFIVFDAAIPSKAYPLNENKTDWSNWKQDYFLNDTYSGVFGLSLFKEGYWVDALNWLAKQDTDIANDADRPAFISWWDYGFYEAAIGKHPTVADNFQDGISTASNFHTATSEKDAVAIWIVRILEGNKAGGNGILSENVKEILTKYLGQEKADNLFGWIENPLSSPSYHKWIYEEFNQYMRNSINTNLLKVGAQWADNAVYHDVVELFNNKTNGLTEEQVTWLYHDLQEETGYSIRYYGVEGYDRQIFNIFAFLADKSLVLLGSPEDEFFDVLYIGYKVKPTGGIDYEITNEPFIDYLKLSDAEKRYIAVTGTSYTYKDAYFNTMFYRTYVGPYQIDSTTGKKSMYDWQVPCLDMKHFYAEFISNMSNPFLQYPGTNKASVVIAKYYEGAIINGSVYFQGKPISTNVTVVVRKNLTYVPGKTTYDTPIDYDKHEIIAAKKNTHNFSLIAGGGAYISVIRNPELRFYSQGILPFVMQRVMFDSKNDTDYAPISEADAMRKTGSNFERTINITIYPANVSGYVYDNLDGKSGYNTTTGDKPLDTSMLLFYEIDKFNESQIANGRLVPEEVSNTPNYVFTNESGYYNISGLLPGYYALNVYTGDYMIYQEIIPFATGNNTLDIARPINSSVSGTVYYNNDDNSSYNPDVDETISDAKVELIYYSNLRQTYLSSKNTTTNSNGYYSFTDIVPGDYYIQAVKGSEYQAAQQLTIKENTTQTFNISMDLAPVNVSGYAKYLTTPVENATVTFEKDGSISKNTAVTDNINTNKNGYYTINLQPGAYNITVTKENTALEYYLEGEKLTITKGQETASKDFTLIKKSVTVT